MQGDGGGARQQISGVLLGIGATGVAALVSGTLAWLGATFCIVVGLWLLVEPVAPQVLPIVRERDGLGRVVFRPQVPRVRRNRRIRRADLRERAAALSMVVFEMVNESKRTDPTSGRHYAWRPDWEQLDEAQRIEARAAFTDQLIGHSMALVHRYNVECCAEALALHDEFQRVGITDGSERIYFEHPTNPLGLEEVARHLGVWAKKV